MSLSSLFPKLGLALIGQALPEASVLEAHAKNARNTIIYGVISAIFFAGVGIVMLYGLQIVLLLEGLSFALSVIIPTAIGLLVAIICMQRANQNVKDLSQLKTSLNPLAAENVSHTAGSIVDAFIAGFMQEGDERSQAQQVEEPAKETFNEESAPREKIILVKD